MDAQKFRKGLRVAPAEPAFRADRKIVDEFLRGRDAFARTRKERNGDKSTYS